METKQGFKAEQVMNGTYGEVWVDGNYVAEIISGKAKVSHKLSDVPQAGKLVDGKKITKLEPKGEIKIHHVNDRIMKKEAEAINKGKTPTHTIIMKLADPDAAGAERAAFYNCIFEETIFSDFENGKLGERNYPFVFDSWELLETSSK